MASNYSDRLKLELMETGANANTWGNNTNTNLETIDAFGAGYLSKSVAGSANVTLTSNNADPDAEASNKVIEFTGTLTGNIYVFIPAVENNYIFFNNTSGSFSLTVAPTGHSANGVEIVQGAHTIQYCTGDDVVDLFANSLGTVSVKNLVNVSSGVTITANGQLTATSFTGNGSGLDGVSTLDPGTQMVFLESTAPTGWTQNTAAALANSTLRVVTGTASTGGSNDFSQTFGSSRNTGNAPVSFDMSGTSCSVNASAGNTSLGVPTISSHSHGYTARNLSPPGAAPGFGGTGQVRLDSRNANSGTTGGGGGHNHPVSSANASMAGSRSVDTSYTIPNMDIKHANTIVCSKD